jgi:hypothetical protein
VGDQTEKIGKIGCALLFLGIALAIISFLQICSHFGGRVSDWNFLLGYIGLGMIATGILLRWVVLPIIDSIKRGKKNDE